MTVRSYRGIAPDIHRRAYVHDSSVLIGKVQLGAYSSVWPMAVIRGDVNTISIGSETNIQDGAVLHVTHDSKFMPGGQSLLVADRVTIGHNATLHACTIGSTSLVGMGSVVLDGAELEPGTMLGAGSLVPMGKTLEGGYLWMGSPAKKIRALKDREREFLVYSANHYVKLSREYLEMRDRESDYSGSEDYDEILGIL